MSGTERRAAAAEIMPQWVNRDLTPLRQLLSASSGLGEPARLDGGHVVQVADVCSEAQGWAAGAASATGIAGERPSVGLDLVSGAALRELELRVRATGGGGGGRLQLRLSSDETFGTVVTEFGVFPRPGAVSRLFGARSAVPVGFFSDAIQLPADGDWHPLRVRRLPSDSDARNLSLLYENTGAGAVVELIASWGEVRV